MSSVGRRQRREAVVHSGDGDIFGRGDVSGAVGEMKLTIGPRVQVRGEERGCSCSRCALVGPGHRQEWERTQ
jgi:hypothetical protein